MSSTGLGWRTGAVTTVLGMSSLGSAAVTTEQPRGRPVVSSSDYYIGDEQRGSGLGSRSTNYRASDEQQGAGLGVRRSIATVSGMWSSEELGSW